MQPKSNMKLKYCPILDSFIKIREFSPDEIDQLLSGVEIPDKRAYQEFVVSTAVPEYREKYLAVGYGDMDGGYDEENVVEELYRMCIKVNPTLNIYNISIPVHSSAESASMRLAKPKAFRSRIREAAGIEKALRRRVIGQDDAVARVARAVQSARLGIRDAQRPVGCFLFAGQTGVGKTELAKALAELLTGSEKNMVRVDCSEFSQPHEYSKLIGAPPGYVGYEDGGNLGDALAKHPENVVLFDEIEKANTKLHNLLLQIMDEGYVSDNRQRRICFRQAVVILTSNVGTQRVQAMKGTVGFCRTDSPDASVRQRETLKGMRTVFSPEFLNRLDDIICFNSLSPGHSRDIVRQMLQAVRRNLADTRIGIRFTRGVVDYLVRNGMDPDYGARPLKRAIRHYIETPLTELIIQEPPPLPASYIARVSGGKVQFVRQQNGRLPGRAERTRVIAECPGQGQSPR